MVVVFDRIVWAFNEFGATRAVALDMSKNFCRVLYAGCLPSGISGWFLALISYDLTWTRLTATKQAIEKI